MQAALISEQNILVTQILSEVEKMDNEEKKKLLIQLRKQEILEKAKILIQLQAQKKNGL